MSQDDFPKDHAEGDDYDSSDTHSRHGRSGDESPPSEMERNLKSKSTWLRFLFMIIAAVFFSLACAVGGVVVLLQFFWVLFTGKTKPEFTAIGHQIALYACETIDFLSYNAEERPFPFDKPWPAASREGDSE
jgi:hypothetical protein